MYHSYRDKTMLVTATQDFNQPRATKSSVSHGTDDTLGLLIHEMRTPLQIILGFAQILIGTSGRPSKLTKEQRHHIEQIIQASHLMKHIMESVQQLAMLETGTLPINICPLDCGKSINKSFDAFTLQASERQQKLINSIDPDLPLIAIDPTHFDQILNNLIGNAIKFTPPGGTITIRASVDASQCVCICIEDTGPGIAKKDQQHIFQPYVQVTHDIVARSSGAGLGLALVQRLVQLYGGNVTVTSRIRHGSTFCVCLPAKTDFSG
jgi:signal transduction histidine kinase